MAICVHLPECSDTSGETRLAPPMSCAPPDQAHLLSASTPSEQAACSKYVQRWNEIKAWLGESKESEVIQ